MKALLLALLALALVEWLIRQPSQPHMVGEGRDWLNLCRNGGAAWAARRAHSPGTGKD